MTLPFAREPFGRLEGHSLLETLHGLSVFETLLFGISDRLINEPVCG